jgi:hypothetical protein
MLKTFFVIRPSKDQTDDQVEQAMQAIHDRMDRMLKDQDAKRQRFSTPEKTPSYYRA